MALASATEDMDVLITKYSPDLIIGWNHFIGPVHFPSNVIRNFDKHATAENCIGKMVLTKLRKVSKTRKRSLSASVSDCDWEATCIVKLVHNKFQTDVFMDQRRHLKNQYGVARVEKVDAVCINVYDASVFLFCEKLGEIKITKKFTKGFGMYDFKPMETYVLTVKFADSALLPVKSQPSQKEVYWTGEQVKGISSKKFPEYFTTLYNFYDGQLDERTPAPNSGSITIPGMSPSEFPIYFDYSDVYLYDDASKVKTPLPLATITDILVQAKELKGYCTPRVFQCGRPWRTGRRALFVAPVTTAQVKENPSPPKEEDLITLEDSEMVASASAVNDSGLGLGGGSPGKNCSGSSTSFLTSPRLLSFDSPPPPAQQMMITTMPNIHFPPPTLATLPLQNIPPGPPQSLFMTSTPQRSVGMGRGERIVRLTENGGGVGEGAERERGGGGSGNVVDLLGSLDEVCNAARLPPPLSPPRTLSRAISTPSLVNYGREEVLAIRDMMCNVGETVCEPQHDRRLTSDRRSSADAESSSSRISDDVSSLCPSEEGSGGSGSGGGGGGERKDKTTVEIQTEDIKELQVIRRMLADESIFDVISTKRPDILRDIITIIT